MKHSKSFQVIFKKSFSIIAVSLAILLLVAARIEFIEKSSLAAAKELNLSFLDLEQKTFVKTQATVTDFPTQTANSGGDSFAVKAKYVNGKAKMSIILWIKGSEVAFFSPGTEIMFSGFAKKHPAASMFSYEIAVNEYEVIKNPYSLVAFLRTNLNTAAANITGASLVPGFAVGDTGLVDEELDLNMKASSLTHLTAVSGSNCALITALVINAAGRLGIKRKQKFVLAAIFLLAFVAVVGPDPSVQRAAIMAGVALISGFGGKKAVANASLATAIIILLLMDPWQSRAPGFTLSVAATAGILFLVPALEKLIRLIIILPKVLTLPVTVSIAAQITCAPLLLLLQDGLPVAGIPANVLAAPAAPVGTGLGLLALVTLPFSQSFGSFIILLASYPARWVEATAEVTASLPLARWYWPGTVIGALLLLIVEALIVAAYIYWNIKKLKKIAWEKPVKQSSKTIFISTILGVSAVSIFMAVTLFVPLTNYFLKPKNWVLLACDVGQGDATFVRPVADRTKTVLIDTGENADLLQKCLRDFKIKKIDLLVLTHDDQDHIGAIDEVIGKTENVLIAPDLFGQEHFERPLVQKLVKNKVPYEIVHAEMVISFENVPQFYGEVVWPEAGKIFFDDNASSIVLQIQNAAYSFLLLGDTGASEHQEILNKKGNIASDVFKVAHHGSGDFLPELISTSSPKIGVISAGANNRYGHPHEDVLASLAENNVLILRTDIHGSVAVVDTVKGLKIWTKN